MVGGGAPPAGEGGARGCPGGAVDCPNAAAVGWIGIDHRFVLQRSGLYAAMPGERVATHGAAVNVRGQPLPPQPGLILGGDAFPPGAHAAWLCTSAPPGLRPPDCCGLGSTTSARRRSAGPFIQVRKHEVGKRNLAGSLAISRCRNACSQADFKTERKLFDSRSRLSQARSGGATIGEVIQTRHAPHSPNILSAATSHSPFLDRSPLVLPGQ